MMTLSGGRIGVLLSIRGWLPARGKINYLFKRKKGIWYLNKKESGSFSLNY